MCSYTSLHSRKLQYERVCVPARHPVVRQACGGPHAEPGDVMCVGLLQAPKGQ